MTSRHDQRHDYRALPEPVAIEDLVTTHEAQPPPDPHAGRNPEQDFVLRYAGF